MLYILSLNEAKYTIYRIIFKKNVLVFRHYNPSGTNTLGPQFMFSYQDVRRDDFSMALVSEKSIRLSRDKKMSEDLTRKEVLSSIVEPPKDFQSEPYL